ncbi:MAG: hypothetical protein JXR51_07385 [Bacteroidales bacterium]|nr:hypothetical protein [Bacteroidales bacterium]MBN2756985.1 hypothetical protein [Bacteroidales bacterium]
MEKNKNIELNYIDIPKVFYAEKSNNLFSKCIMCDKNLLEENTFYHIEKSLKKNLKSGQTELIFEYALCINCQQKIAEEFSKETIERIKMYYDLYVDFKKRYEELTKDKIIDVNSWISNCIFTKKPISELNEYHIGALCVGKKLILDALPFAVSWDAINEMESLYSKKTKDALDGFKDLIMPPEIREKIPDGSRVILI